MVLYSTGWDVMYRSRFYDVQVNNHRENLKDKYEDWMLQGLIDHLKEGCSFQSFSGKIPMSIANWHRIGNDVPEIRDLKLRYNYLKRRRRDFCLKAEIPVDNL